MRDAEVAWVVGDRLRVVLGAVVERPVARLHPVQAWAFPVSAVGRVASPGASVVAAFPVQVEASPPVAFLVAERSAASRAASVAVVHPLADLQPQRRELRVEAAFLAEPCLVAMEHPADADHPAVACPVLAASPPAVRASAFRKAELPAAFEADVYPVVAERAAFPDAADPQRESTAEADLPRHRAERFPVAAVAHRVESCPLADHQLPAALPEYERDQTVSAVPRLPTSLRLSPSQLAWHPYGCRDDH